MRMLVSLGFVLIALGTRHITCSLLDDDFLLGCMLFNRTLLCPLSVFMLLVDAQ